MESQKTYHSLHASGLGLVTVSPGDLAPDFVVELDDPVDGLLVLDLAPGYVVGRGVQVVRAVGT